MGDEKMAKKQQKKRREEKKERKILKIEVRKQVIPVFVVVNLPFLLEKAEMVSFHPYFPLTFSLSTMNNNNIFFK